MQFNSPLITKSNESHKRDNDVFQQSLNVKNNMQRNFTIKNGIRDTAKFNQDGIEDSNGRARPKLND